MASPPDVLLVKVSALQYILEVLLANQFGGKGAHELERAGKHIADHARQASCTPAPGSGPMDLEEARAASSAIADEVERIFRNGADRVRSSR